MTEYKKHTCPICETKYHDAAKARECKVKCDLMIYCYMHAYQCDKKTAIKMFRMEMI
jgi:hypothetical protein